jgi:hypothetical protein
MNPGFSSNSFPGEHKAWWNEICVQRVQFLDFWVLSRLHISPSREAAEISCNLSSVALFWTFTSTALLQLDYASKWWTVNLHQNASLKTTHDLNFMISPWARVAWELNRDVKAYETLLTAAKTLGSRYNTKTKCLRSWDTCVTKRYSFTDPSLDFLVIIVSLYAVNYMEALADE